MNDVLKAISKRRSVRVFTSKEICREDIDAIIEAGLYAPSANNTQNWHFSVVQNKSIIEKANKWILEEIDKSGNPSLQELVKRGKGSIFRNAPTVIIVSTETKDRFGIINAAAATENMLIAAESLGIASCWIGMVAILSSSKNLETYAKELQIPEGYTPQIGITLGYREGGISPAPARRQHVVSYVT
jgi:nitroreductase